ncbi:hypothetical protein PHLGIDRAFT_31396 [Phlebiopsis gigantea 11061_1 CR5-6]|uniref:N-acetylglucosaminylphosphatidylinositol deacetylase n=1 Tax=Phlebiopsis gigantea (strain 11061_1 CR5-6) TaxID=745531 RepID=A0A0C3S3F8_PHLG1|nr:hypothetical protein PHLGIDRAFT_31396 [Phlebiopsis gigantea 11061_1 CR5-6]
MLAQLSLLFLFVSFVFRAALNPTDANVDALLGGVEKPRVLLLTAHPDDECMFFTPTLSSLLVSPSISKDTEKSNARRNAEVYSLCLSVGDAEGLGAIRRDELARSLDVLGVAESKRWVVDHPDLPDNITLSWDEQLVAETIRPYVLENKITTILTFDRKGVSSHPNHASLLRGAANSVASLPQTIARPRLFSLITVPVLHKYIGPFSAVLAKFDLVSGALLKRFGVQPPSNLPVFVSGVDEYKTALRAMKQHESQLVWFRWLYVSFSRYMWVNEWVEVSPSSAGRPPRTA